MSRSISRPWIVEAVTSPGPLPSLPSAQVVGFEDTPVEDSDDTQHRVQIVGRLSDKQVWIYAIFTVDAVEHFGESDFDLSLPGICGGVIILKRYAVAHSNPLAIIVEEFAFIGSEGCQAFGDPMFCMLNESIARHASTHASGFGASLHESEQEDSAALITELTTILSHTQPEHTDEEIMMVAAPDRSGPVGDELYRSSIITALQMQGLCGARNWFSQTSTADQHTNPTSAPVQTPLSQSQFSSNCVSPTLLSPPKLIMVPNEVRPAKAIEANSSARVLPSRNKWSKTDLEKWVGYYWSS